MKVHNIFCFSWILSCVQGINLKLADGVIPLNTNLEVLNEPGPKTNKEKGYVNTANPLIPEGYTKIGDLLVPSGFLNNTRDAVTHTPIKWTGGVVPYLIGPTDDEMFQLVYRAIEEINSKTCVRFMPRTSEKTYVVIFRGESCYTHLGAINQTTQVTSIGPECLFFGSVVHQLLHVLGFYHEHNRSDRDEHLQIYWNNIEKGMEDAFFKLATNKNVTLGDYDSESIMQYGDTAYSKDGRLKTLSHKQGKPLAFPATKHGLSDSDVKMINKAYGC